MADGGDVDSDRSDCYGNMGLDVRKALLYAEVMRLTVGPRSFQNVGKVPKLAADYGG